MIVVAYALLFVFWLLASLAEGLAPPWWTFPLLVLLHAAAVLRIGLAGRRDLPAGAGRGLVVMALFLALPPTAPAAACLLAAGVARRAALRRGPGDALGRALMAGSKFWWSTGLAGVGLGVTWAYAAFEAQAEHAFTFHPWSDPLLAFRMLLGPVLRVVLLAAGLWEAMLLARTLTLLERDRRHPVDEGTLAAGDVVY